MRAILEFDLPDDQGDFDRARVGSEAVSALWEIDQRCRSLLKHGNPGEETAALAEEIREMIPREMMEL